MFKKGRKKSREEAAKNEKNLSKGVEIDKQVPSLDQTDGFDKNGFVDLQPEESNATVLGPKQSCKYVGTFAVMSGNDGYRTLDTHKKRTNFVKDQLREYRAISKGVAVVLQMSTDGIKVFSSDGKRVRMAYPLQRISFATCDPDYCLFAFMTNSPSPAGVAVHGHVFVTHRPKQVQDITAMIGKAFKLAFAASRIPGRSESQSDVIQGPAKQGRRWAKHELTRGHDLSEHAEKAADLKKKAKKVATKQNSSSSTDGSPVLQRAGVRRLIGRGSPPEQRPQSGAPLGDDVVPDSLAHIFAPISISSQPEAPKASKKTDDQKPPDLPPPRTQTPPVLPPARPQSHSFSDSPAPALPARPQSHSFSDPSAPALPARPQSHSFTGTPPALPPQRPLSEVVVAPALPPRNQSGSRAQTPREPPSLPLKDQSETSTQAYVSVLDDEVELSRMPESKTKMLLGGTRAETPPGPEGAIRVEYIGTVDDEKPSEKSSQASKTTSYQDEHWYMPGIPREFIMEMLQASDEGSFFVRDSQSKQGCHALTVRVPEDFHASGFGNYLITPVPAGVKLEGFTKTFPDLMSLIEHHARTADGLPCNLLLAGSNMLCENSNEYMDFDPVDPDYRLLSDFQTMMDELK